MGDERMDIRIIGMGFLGETIERLLGGHYDIHKYDPDKGYHSSWAPPSCRLDIVCVPTPPGPNGECNTSIVRKVVMESKADLILIKSTVAPGTVNQLRKDFGKRIVFSPEYVGESRYHVPDKYLDPEDATGHGFMILGGLPKDCEEIMDIFLPVVGPTCRFRMMDALDAEIVKYAENSFFAMKVTFANELRKITDALGGYYPSVREGWLDDPRVGPMHTAAFKHAPGFSGKCLPKDISAFAFAAREAGYPSFLLEAVIKANNG